MFNNKIHKLFKHIKPQQKYTKFNKFTNIKFANIKFYSTIKNQVHKYNFDADEHICIIHLYEPKSNQTNLSNGSIIMNNERVPIKNHHDDLSNTDLISFKYNKVLSYGDINVKNIKLDNAVFLDKQYD